MKLASPFNRDCILPVTVSGPSPCNISQYLAKTLGKKDSFMSEISAVRLKICHNSSLSFANSTSLGYIFNEVENKKTFLWATPKNHTNQAANFSLLATAMKTGKFSTTFTTGANFLKISCKPYCRTRLNLTKAVR